MSPQRDKLRNYNICLEDSIKEAQRYNLKIPEKCLSTFNNTLTSHLSIDKNDLEVKAAFETAKEFNEKFAASTSLTFSTANCQFSRGRYSCFRDGGSLYMISLKSVTNYDCIPGNDQ